MLVMKDYVDWYREGGVTVACPTVGGFHRAMDTFKFIGSWLQFIKERDDLVLIRTAGDIKKAKAEGKLGVLMHFQGTDPIEDCLDLVNVFKSLGVSIMQLTYNVKNRIGDGIQERTDAGLSTFGANFIHRCNQQGVIVDCSHTGYQTSMEAIEVSEQPVILSHANPRGVFDRSRNVPDDLIRAIAKNGGVIGVVGYPGFVADSPRPTLNQFMDHIDYLVNIAGIDHVGLGIDYYAGMHGVADLKMAMQAYQEAKASGRWSGDAYPPPPYYYPEGIETPQTLSNLTAGLMERGYSEQDTRKILGSNWTRVYETVLGE
ncbi:dipeptidase [Sneathiella chinensis]|uniref:Dipeptidase n=1 Tax=Sneathiella chinensis TaxID=349750 RepID=A0ABQ5TZ65_9PROT|nr:dipeptidase [Sneathiella chinensis]